MLTLQGAPAWDSAGNIDWNLVKESEPSLIRKLRDVDALQPLMDCFLNAKIDPTALSHPLAPRLFQLLQVSIEYLLSSQKELTVRLEKTEAECKKLKGQLQIAKNSQRKAKAAYESRSEELDKARELIEKLRLPSEACPTCGKKFRAGEFLDQHYAKKHPTLESYWRAIRTSAPVMVAQEDIRGLIKEIKELKKETNERHGRARRRFEDAKRVVDEREMGIEEELTATHNDLRADILAAAESARARQRPMRANPAIDIFETGRVNVSNPFAASQATYQRMGVYDPAADAQAAAQMQHQRQMFAQSPVHPKEPLYNSVHPYPVGNPGDFYPPSPIMAREPLYNSVHPYQISNPGEFYQPPAPVQPVSRQPPQEPIRTLRKGSSSSSGKKSGSSNGASALELAKKFLNDELRQDRYRMDSEQMQEMIESVSKRIQAEIAGAQPGAVHKSSPSQNRKRKAKSKSVEPVQRKTPRASEKARPQELSNSDPEHEELLAMEQDLSEEDIIETVPEQDIDENDDEEEPVSVAMDKSARRSQKKHKRKRSHSRDKPEEEPKPFEVHADESDDDEDEQDTGEQEKRPVATITVTYGGKKKPWKIDPEPAAAPRPSAPSVKEEDTDPFALRESGDDVFVIESSSKEPPPKKPEIKRTPGPARATQKPAPKPAPPPPAAPPRTEFKITNSELEELMASSTDGVEEEPKQEERKSPRGLAINNSELDALLAISESETPPTLPKPEKRPIQDEDDEEFLMGTHQSMEGSQTFQTKDARGFRGSPPKPKRLLHFTDF